MFSDEQPTRSNETDRGVSDVLAFSLTFGIIIVGVGLVSLVALDPITAFSESQEITNSERGLQAAGATIDGIHRSGDVYNQFDLVPGGGGLFVNETSITLEGPDGGGLGDGLGDSGDDITIQTNALEQQFDEESLGFEAGAVFRTDAAGLSSGPAIRCDGDQAIISLVNLTTTDDISTGGEFSSDVRISPTREPAETPATAANQFASFEVRYDEVQQNRTDGNVSIDVSETASPENWNQHFDDAGLEEDEDDIWECGADQVFVRIVTIELGQLE